MPAIGQFLDLPAMATIGTKGPTNVDRIAADKNGTLWLSVKGGLMIPLLPASGDKQDMFKQRAQAFISGPFTTQFIDGFGVSSELATTGFAATSAAVGVTSGRTGGSRVRYTSSGAGGFHFEWNVSQETSLQSQLVASQPNDAWYVESGLVVNALTTTGELGFVGFFQPQPGTNLGATDGASGPYISLGISGAVSTTTLTVRAWNSALTTIPTTIPVELGTYRIYGLANDGMGTWYITRDGVIMTSFQAPPTLSEVPGTLMRYERALGGTTDVTVDYWAGAGAVI